MSQRISVVPGAEGEFYPPISGELLPVFPQPVTGQSDNGEHIGVVSSNV